MAALAELFNAAAEQGFQAMPNRDSTADTATCSVFYAIDPRTGRCSEDQEFSPK